MVHYESATDALQKDWSLDNSLTTWVNMAFKCPICSNKTNNTEVISPIYLSSNEDLAGKSTPGVTSFVAGSQVATKRHEWSFERIENSQ